MVSQQLHVWPADKWNLAKDANGQLVQDYMEASGQHQHTTSLKHGCQRQLSEMSADSASMKVVPNVVSAGASRALVAVNLQTAPSPGHAGCRLWAVLQAHKLLFWPGLQGRACWQCLTTLLPIA